MKTAFSVGDAVVRLDVARAETEKRGRAHEALAVDLRKLAIGDGMMTLVSDVAREGI